MDRPVREENAVEDLACRLFSALEHLDPCGESWAQIRADVRDIYRFAVADMLGAPMETIVAAKLAAISCDYPIGR
jgi:hypothetical protein